MDDAGKSKPTPARVAEHRRDMRRKGMERVEVRVPAADSDVVRKVAKILLQGGAEADWLREQLEARGERRKATTGSELLAFFRASPLVGQDIVFERDRGPGRPIDIE